LGGWRGGAQQGVIHKT
jgi:hypothetical protein